MVTSISIWQYTSSACYVVTYLRKTNMCLGAYSATVLLLLLLFRRPAANGRGVRQPLRHAVRAGCPAQPHSGPPGRSRAQVSRHTPSL